MKAELSPLTLNDFNLIELSIKTIYSNGEVSLSSVFEGYELDIDFVHQVNDDGVLIVQCKIEVNRTESPLWGYQVFVEGIGEFSIKEPNSLSKEDKTSLFYNSATSITIQALRSIVSRATSDSPFGKYMIPTFDLNKLLQQKYGSTS